MATTSQAQGVPPELVSAVKNAYLKYDVPPDLLFGIWAVETGRHYPNPYANGLGYGGEFGTAVATPFGPASATKQITEPPVQQQADTAAKILANLLATHQGNISDALMAYSGGGYSSVPGESTYGTYVPKKSSGGGGIGGVLHDIGSAPGDVVSAWKGGTNQIVTGGENAVKDALGGATSWVENILVRGGKIVLGAGLVMLGLYLIARSFNAAPSLPGVGGVLPGGGSSGNGGGDGGGRSPSPPDSRENASGKPLSQSSAATRRRAGFRLAADEKPARGAPGSTKLAAGDSIPF